MKLSMSARAQAFVLLALVATSGALAGVVGDRLLHERTPAVGPSAEDLRFGPPAGGPWRWEPRADTRYSARLAESLALSPEQQSMINQIVAEEQVRVRELTRELQPRFRAIAHETRERIEDVLTAEQRQRLHALREERMRGMGPRDVIRGGPPRDGALRNGPLRARRDSIMRERRDSIMRQRRDSIVRERRDSIVRERRDSIVRERRDSIVRERRNGVMRERRDTVPGGF